MSARSAVHELTITLLGVEPHVWRRVQVPSGVTLSRVHGDIQAVMGWSNSHLHQFEIGGIRYGSPDPDYVPVFGDPVHDERKPRLGSLAEKGLFRVKRATCFSRLRPAGIGGYSSTVYGGVG